MGLQATFVRRPGEKGYWDAVSRYERVKESEQSEQRDWGYLIAGGIIASMFWLACFFVWY